MVDYRHGEMDVTAQEKTFHGFLTWLKWSAIIAIITLLFVAMVNG